MKGSKLKMGVAVVSVLLFLTCIISVYAASFLFGLNTPKSGGGDNNGPPTNSNPYTFSVCTDTSFGEGPAVEYSVNGGAFTCAPCSFVASNTTKCAASVFTCTIPRQNNATVQYQFFNLSTFGDCNSSRSLFTGFSTFTTDASGNPVTYNGSATQPTAADGEISGRVLNEDGNGLAGVAVRLSGAKSLVAVTDAAGFYRFTGVETNGFYTLAPSRANFSFTPGERSFSSLAEKTEATFTASALPERESPLDTNEFFVRQQYLDMLGREPDAGGLNYWNAQLGRCGADADCLRRARVSVAAAFFIEREARETGGFLYGMYKASYGEQPSYAQYVPDRSRLVGGDNLEANKASFVNEWVGRAEFTARYPSSMSGAEFVDQLLANVRKGSGVDLSARREQLINDYASAGRAGVLREVVESEEFSRAEYNRAFVLAEYFGYLRRDPDQAGLDFWLNVLNNRVPGNYRSMVCAFITSREYQERFGSVISHSNGECESR